MTTYRYIDSSDELQNAIARLSTEPVLGVDTEAAGYHRYADSLSLVQISSRHETVLIDPLALPQLAPLGRLLEADSIEKVFHDADFDLRILDRDAGLHVRNLFDTQIAAACLGLRGLGLGAVVETCLGISLPKAFQRADWAERPLTAGMKEYAATDTAHLPALRDELRHRLVEAGRLHWAEEEFARREATRWSPADAHDAFLKLKGARDLSRRSLAILRELHAWRDVVAAERDRAAFRVVSNDVLLQLARLAPTEQAALRQVKGLSSGLIDRRGSDLLAAIGVGRAVPEADLPRFPPPQRRERDDAAEARADRLRDARNRVAEALGLDPGFLASRSVLDEIAKRAPSRVEELTGTSGLRRWQVEVLGRELIQALHAA